MPKFVMFPEEAKTKENEDLKTIKQLADELGVSKDKIKYRVGKLPTDYRVKINGITYLKTAAISQITNEMGKNYPPHPGNLPSELPTFTPHFTHPEKGDLSAVVAVLQTTIDTLQGQLTEKDKQLAEKDRQLAEKDKQIAALNDRLSESSTALVSAQQLAQSAQALHAGTIQQQLTGEVEPKKKRWWQKG